MSKIKQITIERLNALKDPKKQISFSYSVCSRLLPNYIFFSKTFQWGNPDLLTELLSVIEKFIIDNSLEIKIPQLLAEIDKNTPDSDDFETHYCGYAQNATSAIYYTLNSLQEVNTEELSWVHSASLNTIYAFVANTEGFISPNDLIDDPQNHWMMKREINKQESDFQLLMSATTVDKIVLEKLIAFNDGKSNIDII